MNQLQRKLSNGMWIDESKPERIEMLLGMAARVSGSSVREIQAQLDAGQEVRHDAEDWYSFIRMKPGPRTRRAPEMRRGQVCRHCGGSEFSGSMFTTAPSSGYCDDCYN